MHSSADFAKPIMIHLRGIIHKACPKVEEHIKWGMPAFYYKGPLCSFAAFKQHAVFGFWKTKLLMDPKGYLQERSAQGGDAMGNLGRITSLKDLPPDKIIIDFIKQAMKLNEDGIKVKKEKAIAPKELNMHPDFAKALTKNRNANAHFTAFSASQQREYTDWINEAKTETTRKKRLEQAIAWITEEKKRNWKYEPKK
jgi:uncharacterized protein YdeI (YjbR/CyaY-like superfamily)